MLLQQQAQLVKQQQEALQMAMLAKQQAEQAASSAAEEALRKAEAMKRRITPPAKPGVLLMLSDVLNFWIEFYHWQAIWIIWKAHEIICTLAI